MEKILNKKLTKKKQKTQCLNAAGQKTQTQEMNMTPQLVVCIKQEYYRSTSGQFGGCVFVYVFASMCDLLSLKGHPKTHHLFSGTTP